MPQTIDKKWFLKLLDERQISVRGLARHMDLDASAVSRMLSGQRKMQMDEARTIAHFLRAPVSEVMKHAGVSVDLDGLPTRIMLAAVIGEDGYVERLKDPRPLPQDVIDKAQAVIRRAGNSHIIAAQIRASKGPLSIWDDAVVLFRPTEIVEPSAIGSLAICRNRDTNQQAMVRVIRARKTGEATVQRSDGALKECTLDTASPVISVIP